MPGPGKGHWTLPDLEAAKELVRDIDRRSKGKPPVLDWTDHMDLVARAKAIMEKVRGQGNEPDPPPEPETCPARQRPDALSYWCTLPKGHAGDHVAHGERRAGEEEEGRELARWPSGGKDRKTP